MNTKILEQLEETFAQEIALAGNDLGSSKMLVQEKLQAERRQFESARPLFLLLFNLLRHSQDLRRTTLSTLSAQQLHSQDEFDILNVVEHYMWEISVMI